MGLGLGENAQATTPGGLGLRRGPWRLGLKPGVGRGKQGDMAGCQWPKQTSRWASRWPTTMLKKYFFTINITLQFLFLPHSTTIHSTSSIIIFDSHSTKPKMHPHNRVYDPNNPYEFQENNPSPPLNRPMPRPFFIHSPMPIEASYASYLGNRLYTNFPHTEDSIPTPFTQTPINLSPTSIDLSQTETVPETQPPNDGPSASIVPKREAIRKKNRGGEST
ncbi:hypothetical protein HanXRQr2_Chr13g0610461 [Helianthus annuus]|uniref:Uncharacterized protein n=1 Tax=Helianthus annuus TaxID=4232 RepID=A0A9K3EK85_HELAN|nr:hypothetical protein HanXRQr2_Chr13g0610461 [Helianthus annuus]